MASNIFDSDGSISFSKILASIRTLIANWLSFQINFILKQTDHLYVTILSKT